MHGIERGRDVDVVDRAADADRGHGRLPYHIEGRYREPIVSGQESAVKTHNARSAGMVLAFAIRGRGDVARAGASAANVSATRMWA